MKLEIANKQTLLQETSWKTFPHQVQWSKKKLTATERWKFALKGNLGNEAYFFACVYLGNGNKNVENIHEHEHMQKQHLISHYYLSYLVAVCNCFSSPICISMIFLSRIPRRMNSQCNCWSIDEMLVDCVWKMRN